MRNQWKMETSPEYTDWDLNARHVVVFNHGKHRRWATRIKRRHRRNYRQFLKRMLAENTLEEVI